MSSLHLSLSVYLRVPVNEWTAGKISNKIIRNKLSTFKVNEGCECFARSRSRHLFIQYNKFHLASSEYRPLVVQLPGWALFSKNMIGMYLILFLALPLGLCALYPNTGENLINFHSSFYIFRMILDTFIKFPLSFTFIFT